VTAKKGRESNNTIDDLLTIPLSISFSPSIAAIHQSIAQLAYPLPVGAVEMPRHKAAREAQAEKGIGLTPFGLFIGSQILKEVM
jgi:hypothetical protein